MSASPGGSVKPPPALLSGAGEASPQAASDADHRARRQKFLGGNAKRDIRCGQEMKPRWRSFLLSGALSLPSSRSASS
ncbi:DUF2749 domain-containing protein [Rhizobium ruizarguesonis]